MRAVTYFKLPPLADWRSEGYRLESTAEAATHRASIVKQANALVRE